MSRDLSLDYYLTPFYQRPTQGVGGKRKYLRDGGAYLRRRAKFRRRMMVSVMALRFGVDQSTVCNAADPRKWKMARKLKLHPWQVSWARRSAILRPQYTNRALGERLGISASTVKSYLR